MLCVFEIICIGNELLIGKILNTNAQWLAKSVTNLGGRVQRITITGDDLYELSSILHEALSRKPNFIITTGGLGPTFDDKTVEAVAMALNKPLELNQEAFQMVKKKYHNYEKIIQKTHVLTPARIKMAKLPKGSKPLINPLGTAPGVLSNYFLQTHNIKIINLPGVPSEMKAIFIESVLSLIKDSLGNLGIYERILNITGIIESELAPLIDRVRRENPDVYIKSHPKKAEPFPQIELHLYKCSTSGEKAKKQVETAVKQISTLILKHGGNLNHFGPNRRETGKYCT